MSQIEEIIAVLDEELSLQNKAFFTLGQANKILLNRGVFNQSDIENKTLKNFLQKQLIPNSHQTIHEPKQWRITSSTNENDKTEDSIDEQSIDHEDHENEIFCPLCGNSLYIPDELLNASHLHCPNCSNDFHNPLAGRPNKMTLKEKKAQEEQQSYLNIVIVLVIIIVVIVIGVNYCANRQVQQSSDSGSNALGFTESSTKEESKGTSKKIYSYVSYFYDIEKPGVPGYQTVNSTTYHEFDLNKMTVTQTSTENGKRYRFVYHIKSSYEEIKGGYKTYVLKIYDRGVNEIWWTPDVPNLGYDYLDGTRIACYNLTVAK